MSRCVYARCGRAGETLPQGWGFTFCAYHAPAAQALLDGKPQPVGAKKSTDAARTSWACSHDAAVWNIRVHRARGVDYIRCRACMIGYQRKYREHEKWDTTEQAADMAYQELKEKNAHDHLR